MVDGHPPVGGGEGDIPGDKAGEGPGQFPRRDGLTGLQGGDKPGVFLFGSVADPVGDRLGEEYREPCLFCLFDEPGSGERQVAAVGDDQRLHRPPADPEGVFLEIGAERFEVAQQVSRDNVKVDLVFQKLPADHLFRLVIARPFAFAVVEDGGVGEGDAAAD